MKRHNTLQLSMKCSRLHASTVITRQYHSESLLVEQHRRAELEAQMKAREEAKKKERADRLQEDLKVHREAARYDPWGRGGGGAPHQSPTGQPISDLHQVVMMPHAKMRTPL